MEPNRLRELLEATRDDAADQGLSEVEALELRELLADDHDLQVELSRIGAWDRAIVSAAEEITVPSGLAERLRAAVTQELSAQAASNTEATSVAPAGTGPFTSRRGWMSAALAIAALMLLAIGLGTYLSQPAIVDVARLQQETVDLTSDLGVVAWQPEGARYPVDAFPQQLRFKPLRWGHVATSLDAQAIVFDLVRDGAPRAVLVAMQSRAASEELPTQPSLQPTSNTGNVCVGSWHSDDYIYSLVVSGGKARYQLFLRDTGSLTANW